MPSNPIYWPENLPHPLKGPALVIDPRNETLVFETERTRVRKYFPEKLEVFDFQWNFTQDEFDIFKTFYEDELDNGQEAFTIQVLDPDDSNALSIIDYGFFESNYQWSYTDGVYQVIAQVIVELETIEQLEEPFDPAPCNIFPPIWPPVSDGEGGGTTFECYAVGDYTLTDFQTAGSRITEIDHANSPLGYIGGEDYETFAAGLLVLGSPSLGSFLVLMFYSDSPLGYIGGDDYEGETVGSYMGSAYDSGGPLTQSFAGDG